MDVLALVYKWFFPRIIPQWPLSSFSLIDVIDCRISADWILPNYKTNNPRRNVRMTREWRWLPWWMREWPYWPLFWRCCFERVTLFTHVFSFLRTFGTIENQHGCDFMAASAHWCRRILRHGMEHAGLYEARAFSNQAISRSINCHLSLITLLG